MKWMFVILCLLAGLPGLIGTDARAQDDPATVPENEALLLSGTRQLTFEGRRSGEGYFSHDGTMMVFQSERDPENPFYQIFLMDLETGDVDHISPGHGKTTCAWIHPDKNRVLYASTHMDPDARQKQKAELEMRASGKERRYAWDYDKHFDLFAKDLTTGKQIRLTDAMGYDAEGSYSPDGEWIAFASNRHAYTEKMSKEDQQLFEVDKSFMMEIYIMRADGSDVRRLTDVQGYDGGPFFSADGSKICWRRFNKKGTQAEIFTMNIDGSDQRPLTDLGAMSWAPYFHPSGDYLIFATNVHGFGNFELYLVDAAGKQQPVRVTGTDGFDGLPVFLPDGQSLAWTSNRTTSNQSQIFIADWNDAAARRLLGLDGSSDGPAQVDISGTAAGIDIEDLRHHVAALTAETAAGRMTGTPGEIYATDYVAGVFQALGLEPAGDDGTYYQRFPFIAGVSLGEDNQLRVGDQQFDVDSEWRPLAFSDTGEIGRAEVVFAGYGIKAPADGAFDEYDSYVHLDVKDKWVMVFRFLPEDITPEHRRVLNRHASLRYKAMIARDLGAKGLLIVSGPNAQVNDELVPLTFDASLAGTGIAAISITDKVAEAIMANHDKTLAELQTSLDSGQPAMGIALGVNVAANIAIEQETRHGRNVVARIPANDMIGDQALILGAHVDHLGRGEGGGSLARDEEKGQVHHGADDNASGVAGLLEIAQYLSDQQRSGKLSLQHDVLFAAWSGEELGLLGSNYFVNQYGGENRPSLYPELVAYLNMDMIGRLNENLVLQGLGSSDYWTGEIERRNAPIGLPIVTQNDSYLPTDATSFYLKGVPILAAFTGSHEDYHSPRDTPDKLNYEGMTNIVKFMGLVARGLVKSGDVPEYRQVAKPEGPQRDAVMRAYLGTIPDYAQGDIQGVKLSGVSKGGPADKAGVQGGDIIVSLAGKKIANIYDYTYAIEALKIGEETEITVERNGERLTLSLVPAPRD